jgi:Na+-driven multidrug efflux pump
VTIGAFFLALGLTMPRVIVSAFTKETGELVDITIKGIRYYFIAFPLIGINIIMGSYFQSIGKAKYSTVISLCRGIIFTIIGLKVLSQFLGVTGVWLTVPVAEVVTLVIVIAILLKNRKCHSIRLD